ncbi:apolipoprotein N-acyltransferase [Hymenobacter coccineus]|uniref:apolipoprotein N-acyltransferase n=1 Tax=Hymenobacter coccineus TaxID=1908235 RepID=UPI0008A43BE7|nr:apolipoprotein N-acyltransferase [Hymenobacter coccineus]
MAKTSPAAHPAVLAVLGAALLWTGWSTSGTLWPLGLFVGWVPYLLMERRSTQQGARKGRVFAGTYLFVLLWNASTTWWVSYSTLGGGIAAVVLNAGLMCLPLMAFRQTKKRLGPLIGYLTLPVYWVAFEQLHLRWDVTWPWLTLGNGFAAVPQWVQWYEYTGFLGGSVWVWAVNLSVFFWLIDGQLKVKSEELTGAGDLLVRGPKTALLTFNSKLLIPLIAIALPLLLSFAIGATYQEQGPGAEVVVVQPNINPYTEKFADAPDFVSYDEQLTRLLALSTQQLTPQTRLVLWPETSLADHYQERVINNYPRIQRIRAWLGQHPGVALITGMTSIVSYPSKEAASETALFRDDLGYYDVCNTAAYLAGPAAPVQFYHKERLVPGVEKVPTFLTALINHIDLGGYVGSYGTVPETKLFRVPGAPALVVRPLVCYESIYGDFTAQYVRDGANLLGLVTNDAWWDDTPGYRQLLRLGALRAIETRRDLARAANTGFTGFINQKGTLAQLAPTWVRRQPRHGAPERQADLLHPHGRVHRPRLPNPGRAAARLGHRPGLRGPQNHLQERHAERSAA